MPNLATTEPQEAGAGSLSECRGQTTAGRRVDLGRVVLILGDKAAVRGDS